MADTVVSTELKLDTTAGDTLKLLQQGFSNLQSEVRSTQSAAAGMGKQFLATLAAVNVAPAVNKVKSFLTSMFDVTAATDDVEQNIAGMLTGMSGGEWNATIAYAQDLTHQFTDLSIKTGQARSDIIAGQRALTSYLGGGSEAMAIASRNMANLTSIANVQGFTVQELGMQFGRLAGGIVQMESPLFAILRRTGIFHGNLSKVNEEWRKLSQAERISRLEGAFDKIQSNLSKATPTLNDLRRSIGEMGNEFADTFGKSAMSEFMGGLQEFSGDLQGARGDMRAFARDLGRDVGKFAGEAIQAMRDGFQFVRTHSDEIRAAIKEGFQFARDTVKWIIDNRTTLAAIGAGLAIGKSGIGGAAIGGLVKGAGGFAGAMLSTGASAIGTASTVRGMGGAAGAAAAAARGAAGAREVASVTTMAGKFGGAMGDMVKSGGPAVQVGARLAGSMGSLFTTIAAGGPAVWAATAAVTALAGGALYLNSKFNEAEENRNKVIDDNVAEFTKITRKMGELTKQELARLDELRAQAEKMAGDKLISDRVGERFEEAWKGREKDILKAYVHPMAKITESIQRYGEQANDEGLFPEEMGAQRMAVQAAVRLYEQAWAAQDQGAMQYVAKMLGSSEEVRQAFLTSAEMTSEGFMSLASTVRGLGASFSAEFGQQIENVGKAQMELAAKAANPTVNMNGGQVFKIQQNFREADPDRIAIAFEDRFVGAALHRVQATTSTPFAT